MLVGGRAPEQPPIPGLAQLGELLEDVFEKTPTAAASVEIKCAAIKGVRSASRVFDWAVVSGASA